jgi:CP family cyanate transporter-like MFS transporter
VTVLSLFARRLTFSVEGARGALVALVLFGTYAVFGMAWMGVVPVMSEVSTALDIDRGAGAWLISIISLTKSVVPILVGVLAARIGLTTTLRIAAALIALAVIIPWLPSYPAWLAARVLFGIGGAAWVTLMGPAVLAAVDPAKRPMANALNGIAVNVGVIAALAITLPLSGWLGWRGALSLYGVAAGVCLLALLALGRLDDGNKKDPPPLSALLAQYGKTLQLPATWVLSLAFCGPLALYLVLNTWLGTHLQEAFALERGAAMRWLSWMNLWGVPACLGAGVLLVKVLPRARPYLIVAGVLLPFAVAGGVMVTDDAARAILFALAGLALFLPVAPLITLLQRQPNASAAGLGMILGTMFSVTYIVSSIAPSAVAPLVSAGLPLGTVLIGAAILGATPLFGLLLKDAK